MIATIHQPQYLPWLPYFEKVDHADTFVYLDDVQFQKGGFQNRNQIKTSQGKQWLTVPIIHDFGQLINEVEINNREKWRKKHRKSIKYKYNKAEYFELVTERLFEIYDKEWEYLVDLNIKSANLLIDILGIDVEVVLSSDLKSEGEGSEYVLEICKEVGADSYISGQGGKNYLNLDNFKSAGIDVVFQNYSYPKYPQLYTEQGFMPDLSVIDLLLNCGEESLDIIRSGRDY